MKRICRMWMMAVLGLGLPLICEAVEVRTAAQDSQPKFITNGKAITGLCIDIFKAVERVEPELKFTEPTGLVPLPRIEAMLQDGSLDVFCGLAKTGKRMDKFDFIEIPLYKTQVVLAARIDEKADVRNFDDLRKLGPDAVILVVDKTVQAEMLAAQPGLRMDAGGKDTSANLQKLVTGRGRFILQNDFALVDEIRRHKLGDKVKILPAKFDQEGAERYMVLARQAAPQIKEKLRAALDKLNRSGELGKLFRPYAPM